MITRQMAECTRTFYHRTMRYKSKPHAPLECRANGKCKTWVRRPLDFSLPVKYGLRDCFYLTQDYQAQWSVFNPDERPSLCKRVGLSEDVPDPLLWDALQEAGIRF